MKNYTTSDSRRYTAELSPSAKSTAVTSLAIRPAAKRLYSLAVYLLTLNFLVLGTSHATINSIADPATIDQRATLRSFNEITPVAEDLWTSLTIHFVTLYEQGEYQAALRTAEQTHKIALNNFGIDDVNTADTLLKLGIINQTLGKLSTAEDHLLGSLVILEQQLSPDHPDVAVAATNLANVYFDMKRFADSENYHQQALRIRQNAFGDTHPTVAQSIYNLAVLYEGEAKFSKAESYYQQAITLWKEGEGPLHPYVGNALSSLAKTYIAQAKFQQAEDTLKQVLTYKKAVFGVQHEEVAQTLVNLGSTYLEQGKFNRASRAYAEALSIAQGLLSSSDPQLALLMYTLANIYHMQARVGADNNSFTNRAIANNGSTTKDEKPVDQPSDIAAADAAGVERTNTAARQSTALFEQALPLYKQAADILDREHDKNGSTLEVVLTELAMLYKAIGNNDMATATESRLSRR